MTGPVGNPLGEVGFDGLVVVPSPLAINLTALPTVMMPGPRTGPSDLPVAASGTIAGTAANELWIERPPVRVLVDTLSPPTLISVGGASGTVGGAGSPSPESDLSRGSVAVSGPANPVTMASVATFGEMSGGGQTILANTVPSSDDLFFGNGVAGSAGAIGAPPLLTFNAVPPPGGLPEFETVAVGPPMTIAFSGGSSATLALPALRTFLAFGPYRGAPQVTETLDGAASIATNGASSLGSLASVNNAEAVFGITGMNLTLSGTSPVRGLADSSLNTNRIPTLVGGRLAESWPDRDETGQWTSCTMVTAEPHPQCMEEGSSLFSLIVPSPQRFGLITDFQPMDEAGVGPLIDQLLQQLENLGSGLASRPGPTDLVVELLAMVVVLSAWTVVPRILDRVSGRRANAR